VAAPAGAEASSATAKKKPAKSVVYSATTIARCKKATASVKVGGLFELSGALVSFGGPSLVGVQLAQKEVNRTGGFLVGKRCYKLNLSIQDNRSDPTADVAAARGLINDQKVKFLLGPDSGVFAGNDQAISQSTSPPIIHISPTSAWQSNGYMGTPSKPGLFRSGLEQDLTSADFFKGIRAALPGAKSVYFLFRDDDTSKSLVASYLAKAAVARGFEIVGSDRYPPGTTDFSSELSRIKSRNPDVIMVGYVVPDITAVARQASQLGINIPIAGWGGGVSIALKDAVNGPLPIPYVGLYVAPTMEDPQIAATKAFAAKYAATGNPITSTAYYALWYYDPVLMLVKAMQVAKSTTNPTAVRKALRTIRWNGALGFVCFTKQNIIEYGTTTALVKNGKVQWSYWAPNKAKCAPQKR
jgi:branched-chain amino acid transport system substrate-binding protein